MADRTEMSRSFGAEAAAYEAGRPDYPLEAVEWMLDPVCRPGHTPRVADVGAGTGKLTRVAVEAGAEVVAVDPDARMLDTLRAHVAGVPAHVGTAEELPLPDGSLDAVLVAQAWHWVDPEAASTEVARVLGPGGVLGLVWNLRDENVDWVRRMTEVMTPSNAELMLAQGTPPVGPPFGGYEHRRWTWSRPMTRETLFAMARSRSYSATVDDATRARMTAQLGELFDDIGATGDAVVELPYTTEAFRFSRP
jgi:SAM-dependent methyltransferase